MLTRSDAIRVDRDFRYTGEDCHSFLRCCLCRCYTPFIFYIESKKALDVIAKTFPQVHNLFCVNCLPKSTDNNTLYPERCLFNDETFLSMFCGYEYYNPYYGQYQNTNRLIITENVRIHPEYKKQVRKPQPALEKVRKLIRVFPAVHQLPHQKYASMAAMYTEIRKKYREICMSYYGNTDLLSFMDTFDITVERTPQQLSAKERTIRSKEKENANKLFPTDTIMRQASSQESPTSESDDAASLLHISSQSIAEELGNQLAVPYSQRSEAGSVTSVQDEQQSSHSINISSQDVEMERESQFAVPEIAELSLNSSIASFNSSILPCHIRPLRLINDSQEAGPSGLQQPKQPDTLTAP
uniref:Uncharacterized protein n=1 Tax=Anopheles christyi TaxID=43041 RepID=A0A182K4A2_9DIPT